jgi:sodium-dependent dicarboxylate transporter 2/3/5
MLPSSVHNKAAREPTEDAACRDINDLSGVGRRLAILSLGVITIATSTVVTPPSGLSEAGFGTLALLLTMALFWFTEALPITATALLPALILPLLGVEAMGDVAASYMSDIIFLVLGASLLAIAVEKWGLHRRIAVTVMQFAGARSDRLIFALMVATASIAMWTSITATALIMTPVAVAVLGAMLPNSTASEQDKAAFARAAMLGLCYAAAIGGIGTLVGSPTNAIAAGILRKNLGLDITFVTWLFFSMPLLVVALPLIWLLLTRFLFKFKAEGFNVQDALDAIGKPGRLSDPEFRLLPILALVLAAWLGGSFIREILPQFKDASAAVIGALLLFVVPASKGKTLLSWSDARGAPWDILMLFGGGLALSDAIVRTGVSDWMGTQMASLGGMPIAALMLIVVLVIMIATEFASNVATAAGFIPVIVGLVKATGADATTLGMAAALASSWGFMMPCATPANAIALGTGHIRAKDMMRAGILVDALGLLLIPLAVLIGRALI